MSRSNPVNDNPNPSTRWFEWKGAKGAFHWFDKEKKENMIVKLPFTFIVLDQTATVRGYSKKLKTRFYSNEVRDTRDQPFVVKTFSDGATVAEGVWSDIKDKVVARSGKFATNCYIAYRDGKEMHIGAIQFTGCSLGPWFDFVKNNRKDIYSKAVTVKEKAKGETGDVEFEYPVFSLLDVTEDTNRSALELDKELQAYFDGYFKRPSAQRTHPAERSQGDSAEESDNDGPPIDDSEENPNGAEEGDDVPF